ncbi:MAG: cation transporter [Clostridia bacterium]|nr:cation transporter [Clostridia bacterium]
MNNQKQIEKKSLIVSSVVNAIMSLGGFVVFGLTGLQALFLDAFFSFIAFLSNIMAIIFAKYSKKKNSAYPTGMYFLEPLYGIIKALLIFTLLISSTLETSISAYNYWTFGAGEAINILPVLPYSVVMVVLCFGLSVFNNKQNKKINNTSTMLTAESKSNLVDGIISMGVGILILLLLFIDINGPLGFLHYTGDFFITIILVLVSLFPPIKLFGISVREISGATVKDKEIKKTVRAIIRKEIKDENLESKFEVYKIGKHIRVVIIINEIVDKETLLRLKSDSIKEIKQIFDDVSIEFVMRI